MSNVNIPAHSVKSIGHLDFIGDFEYFERDGAVHLARAEYDVMTDGYRCGRFECQMWAWERHHERLIETFRPTPAESFSLAYSPIPAPALPWCLRPVATFLKAPQWSDRLMDRVEALCDKITCGARWYDLDDSQSDMIDTAQEMIAEFRKLAKRDSLIPAAPSPVVLFDPRKPSRTVEASKPIIRVVKRDAVYLLEGACYAFVARGESAIVEHWDGLSEADRKAVGRHLLSLGWPKLTRSYKASDRFAEFVRQCQPARDAVAEQGCPIVSPDESYPSLERLHTHTPAPAPNPFDEVEFAPIYAPICGGSPEAEEIPAEVMRVRLSSDRYPNGCVYMRAIHGPDWVDAGGRHLTVDLMEYYRANPDYRIEFLPLPTTHLTTCGYDNPTLCGCNKNNAREEMHRFHHAMYADLSDPTICPDCLALWQDDSDDEPTPVEVEEVEEFTPAETELNLDADTLAWLSGEPALPPISGGSPELDTPPVPVFPDDEWDNGDRPDDDHDTPSSWDDREEPLDPDSTCLDIPITPDDDQVTGSRVERILIQGTYYTAREMRLVYNAIEGDIRSIIEAIVRSARDPWDYTDDDISRMITRAWVCFTEGEREDFALWSSSFGYNPGERWGDISDEEKWTSFVEDCLSGTPIETTTTPTPDGDDDGGDDEPQDHAPVPVLLVPDRSALGSDGHRVGPRDLDRHGERGEGLVLPGGLERGLGGPGRDAGTRPAGPPEATPWPDTLTIDGRAYGVSWRLGYFLLEKDERTTYEVTTDPLGRPWCSCPDAIHRRNGLDSRGCRHYRAALAAGLLPQAQPAPPLPGPVPDFFRNPCPAYIDAAAL